MYIHRKSVAAFYKLVIGALSLFGEWTILGNYGFAGLRLFPTWVLLLSALYFLTSALLLAANYKKAGDNPYPVLEGVVIMGFWLMTGIRYLFPDLSVVTFPTWLDIVISLVLPILTLLDWLLFVKKGRWQPMAPFYWVALPACYMATMVFTSEFLPEGSILIYPVAFFDYLSFGLLELVYWVLIIFAAEMLVGYILYGLDLLMSGKLAEYIVLPHLRAVEVDDDVDEIDEIEDIEEEGAPEVIIDSGEISEIDPGEEEGDEAFVEDLVSEDVVDEEEILLGNDDEPENDTEPAPESHVEAKKIEDIKPDKRSKKSKPSQLEKTPAKSKGTRIKLPEPEMMIDVAEVVEVEPKVKPEKSEKKKTEIKVVTIEKETDSEKNEKKEANESKPKVNRQISRYNKRPPRPYINDRPVNRTSKSTKSKTIQELQNSLNKPGKKSKK